MGNIRGTFIVVILAIVVAIHFSEVDSRRNKHWGKMLADAFMRPWNDMTKMVKGPSYRYWHHRRGSNGRWEKRKYGHSDSESGSRSSESRSESSSRERKFSSRSFESSSSESSNSRDDRIMEVESFYLFLDSNGCSNVTAFQHFMSSYNKKMDKKYEYNDKGEILHEMSRLAGEELLGHIDPVPQSCPQKCLN